MTTQTPEEKAAAERHNANQFPKNFYARHMQPGLCGYNDEKILLDTDALKRMIGNDAIGKPVYILHNSEPNESRLKNLKDEAAGYITDSFYNELDGWAWFEILVIDDKAHQKIAQGWSVSNAYLPTEWGPGGTKNNVAYDREIVNADFTHLAIVPDPRYEDACIMTPEKFKSYQESKKRQLEELKNSLSESTEGKQMFKMFKNERKEVSSVDADTIVEYEPGKTATVGEMMNAMKKNESDEDKAKREKEEKENAEKAEKENAESMVDCDGEKMPMKEFVNRFKAMKKNEDDRKAADEKKNAEDKEKADKEDKEKKEKENSRFTELQNAHENAPQIMNAAVADTATNKVARGVQRYGSGA